MFKQRRNQVAQMLPISPRMLVGTLIGCVLLVWFLLPNDVTLFERYLNDQEWEKAYETLQNISAGERAKRPEYYALLDIKLLRHTLSDDDIEGISILLSKALEEAQARSYPHEYLTEIEALALKITSGETAYTILQPFLGKMPTQHQKTFIEAIVAKALANGNPIFAARVYAHYWAANPESQEVTMRFVDLSRQAGQPQLALHALEQYANRAGKPLHKISIQLASLHIDLLRESNQPVKAFEAMWRLYDSLNPEARNALFPTLLLLARQSGKFVLLLPELKRRAEADPDNLSQWQTVSELALAAGDQNTALKAIGQSVRLDPENGPLRFRYAQHLEWNALPNDAFDEYMVALRLKQRPALERLLALNPGLYRDLDLAEALEIADDQIDWHQHGEQLARLYINIGAFGKARALYEVLLTKRQNDLKLLQEYGQLLLDLGHYEEAVKIFARLRRLAPDDVLAWKAMAESQFRSGDFETTLQTYASLVRAHPDRSQLENHLRLAESLGRIDEAADLLEDYMRLTNKRSTADYQRLIYFYGVLGNRVKLEETLRDAHGRFPTDLSIRKGLIYALIDSKKPGDAADLLADYPDVIADSELSRLYLGLLMEAKRFQEAENFITQRLPEEMLQEKEILEMLGSIYYTTGNKQGALDLYGRLHSMEPGNVTFAMAYAQYLVDFKRFQEAQQVLERIPEGSEPRALKMVAQIYADAKDYKKAARYQRKYLSTNPKDSARDWGFLGDILATTGDKPGARRAYLKAISQLLTLIAQTSTR